MLRCFTMRVSCRGSALRYALRCALRRALRCECECCTVIRALPCECCAVIGPCAVTVAPSLRLSSGETTDLQPSALQLSDLCPIWHGSGLLWIPLMEPGDCFRGVNEIPRFPGKARPANPADLVLQGPSGFPGVLHSLHMVFGFFTFYHHGRRWWYYLAGKRILRYRGEERNRLDRVDLDVGGELQFVGMA